MTDADALLAAVLANPADDTPRLVYADWLEEHAGEVECRPCRGSGTEELSHPHKSRRGGRPCRYCDHTGQVSNLFAERAEFIRVQCALHDLTYAVSGGDKGWHEQVDALRRRERELLQGGPIGDANWMQWFGSPLPDGAVCDNLNHERTPSGFRFTYRRGFPASVSLTLAQFLGEPCRQCEGSGLAQGSDRPFEYEGHGTWPGPCPGPCKGNRNYRTPGLAPALFAVAPIEQVTLIGKEPEVRPSSGCWRWYFGENDELHYLPSEFHNYIDQHPGPPVFWSAWGVDDDMGYWEEWTSKHSALAALSAACVTYGRANAAGCWHDEGCGECGATGQIRPAFEWIRCPACSGSGVVRVPGLPPLSTHQAGGPAPR